MIAPKAPSSTSSLLPLKAYVPSVPVTVAVTFTSSTLNVILSFATVAPSNCITVPSNPNWGPVCCWSPKLKSIIVGAFPAFATAVYVYDLFASKFVLVPSITIDPLSVLNLNVTVLPTSTVNIIWFCSLVTFFVVLFAIVASTVLVFSSLNENV